MGQLRDALTQLSTTAVFMKPERLNLFVRKGEKYMMAQTRYAGFDVPEMTHKGLKNLVDNFNAGEQDICEGTAPEVDCGRVSCSDCILNHRSVDREARAKAFANYARAKGFKITRNGGTASQSMPETKPGMLVRSNEGFFYLCAFRSGKETVFYQLVASERGITLVDHRAIPPDQDNAFAWVEDIYYDERFGTDRLWLPASFIRTIVRSEGKSVPCAHWHRPKEPVVKEMTVDEIEKALGYKVKVVGNEKADN